MTAIGSRIREERERLKMTQRAFGVIGGVEPNAQGKYESGERWPKADYLAAVADHGVDVLYVLTGKRLSLSADELGGGEAQMLASYRAMPEAARLAMAGMAQAVAAMAPQRGAEARRAR